MTILRSHFVDHSMLHWYTLSGNSSAAANADVHFSPKMSRQVFNWIYDICIHWLGGLWSSLACLNGITWRMSSSRCRHCTRHASRYLLTVQQLQRLLVGSDINTPRQILPVCHYQQTKIIWRFDHCPSSCGINACRVNQTFTPQTTLKY